MCRCPCVLPSSVSSLEMSKGTGWGKIGEKGTWIVTRFYRVSFLLPAPPCFVLISSMDDLPYIKYFTHPAIEGLLKSCIMHLSFVLLITFELRFFSSPLVFGVIWSKPHGLRK